MSNHHHIDKPASARTGDSNTSHAHFSHQRRPSMAPSFDEIEDHYDRYSLSYAAEGRALCPYKDMPATPQQNQNNYNTLDESPHSDLSFKPNPFVKRKPQLVWSAKYLHSQTPIPCRVVSTKPGGICGLSFPTPADLQCHLRLAHRDDHGLCSSKGVLGDPVITCPIVRLNGSLCLSETKGGRSMVRHIMERHYGEVRTPTVVKVEMHE